MYVNQQYKGWNLGRFRAIAKKRSRRAHIGSVASDTLVLLRLSLWPQYIASGLETLNDK